jgi:glycosyltransferase involved in cell wall biosynthesis
MSNPRIFVDCHVFDGGFQGTRSYIKGLYTELVKDVTIDFFLAAHDIEKLRAEFGERPNIIYLAYKSNSKIRRLLTETPALIKKHNIDFAHFQYRVPPVKRCRYIVTTHDVLFEDFPEYFPRLNRISSLLTYRYSARMADLVLTVSEYSKTEISKYLGVGDAVITPNGVADVFFESYDKAGVKETVRRKRGLGDYLIYISRREPRKNQHLLAKYFIELKLYESMELVLLGHETFPNPEMDKLLRELPSAVKSRIRLIDHIGFEDMLELLRGAKASVYPSIAEGFGIPPLESVAARIPTICSNQTAMADFSFFGEDFFDPRDPSDFKDKLLRIATSTEDKSKTEAHHQTVRETYTWKNAAAIFERELRKHL